MRTKAEMAVVPKGKVYLFVIHCLQFRFIIYFKIYQVTYMKNVEICEKISYNVENYQKGMTT